MVQENKQEASPSKLLSVVMLVLVALVLLVPLVTMNLDADALSEADNRPLQPFPTQNGEGDLTAQTSQFFSDRIGFRLEMMAAYAVLNDGLFHVMTHPTYEYGTDGHLFYWYGEYEPDTEYLEIFTDYLLRAQDYCAERGSYFLYVITPEKKRVYSEYIPSTVNITSNIADDLVPLLEKKGINYIDLGQVLLENKADAEVYHKVYNVGHWSDTGAFIGSQAVMRRLQERYPGLYIPDFDDYNAVPETYTTLPVSNIPISEEGVSYTLKDPSLAPVRLSDAESEVLRFSRYPSIRIYENRNRPDAPTLLAFTGSYFNNQDHVTNQPFSRSTYVHNYYNFANLAYYYDLFDPDIVLLDSADYTIYDTYFPRELLRGAHTPPSYGAYEKLPVNVLPQAFAQTDYSGSDAFGPLLEAGPDVAGSITTIQSDSTGTFALTYQKGTIVSNYMLTWAGPPLQDAYARIGDRYYDVMLTGNILEIGFLTSDLEKTEEITIIGIGSDGAVQYQSPLSVTSA